MAAKFEEPDYLPDYPGSVTTKRLEGTLVAKRTKNSVPDHLADTKIYAKVQQNGILQCKPGVIHFDGYCVGEMHQKTLRIINSSRDNQQMHIIPPTTPNFTIKYHKQRNRLVPGLSLDVTVQFKPTKWQYYYDCIRVHCKGDHNLLIPIHAYPVMNTAQFPQSVTFPPTPLGKSRTKSISLTCEVPIDFEFELSCLETHPAFTVTPMKGVVSASSETNIRVTFTPTDFSTAYIKLQLELSQFNSSPLVCTFIGSSTPGLAVEKVKKETTQLRQTKPKIQHVISLSTSKRLSKSGNALTQTQSSKKKEKEIIYDGIHIPVNTDTPLAMNKVLSQKPGKFKANKLKQALSSEDKGELVPTRQVKETAFLQRTREIANEERANQLRWVTHLGSSGLSQVEREQIIQARLEEKKEYEHYCHVPLPEQEFNRPVTKTSYRRTRRQVNQTPGAVPKFDVYINDPWTRRHTALNRFVQAARKVVIQLRCQARLEKLKCLVSDIRAGRTVQESLANLNKDPNIISIAPLLPRSPDHIYLSLFPHYKANSAEGLVTHTTSLSKQPAESIASCVHKNVPYVDLKVPQECQLLGYHSQSVPTYGTYIQPGLLRPLRSGAEEEYSSLDHIPGVDPTFLAPITPAHTLTRSDRPLTPSDSEPISQRTTEESLQMRLESGRGRDVTGGVFVEDVEQERSESTLKELPLNPPQSLFRRKPAHPLDLLNPCPEVASYVPLMDNSVVTFDHVLKPLPAFPTAKHPQVRLDPTDVLPEVMQWKKFPNHYLVATESQRKLVSIWKPRWSDPFSSDLLPAHANSAPELQLLTGPQPDDYVDYESDRVLPVPTMEMVRAQFNLEEEQVAPESNDSRLKALAQLKEEKEEKFDQLGQKIEKKFKTFHKLYTDSP